LKSALDLAAWVLRAPRRAGPLRVSVWDERAEACANSLGLAFRAEQEPEDQPEHRQQ